MTNAKTAPSTALFDALQLNVGILSSNDTDLTSKVGAANQIYNLVREAAPDLKSAGPESTETTMALNSLRVVRDFTIQARRTIPSITDQPFTRKKAGSLQFKVGDLAKSLRGGLQPKAQVLAAS